MFAREGSLFLVPMQSTSNHTVQHQPQVRFQPKGNAFTDSSKPGNALSVGRAEWRVETANQEWFTDANVVENLPADPFIDFLNIENDVGKLGHPR